MVAMGCLSALQLAALVIAEESSLLVGIDAAVAVVCLALIPGLWTRPTATAVALGLLAALSPTATPSATMAVFHVARWSSFRAALTTALVGIGAHLVQGWWRPIEGLPYGWYALLVVVAYATLVGWGAYAKARRELMWSLAERARRAEEEQASRVAEARRHERARLSREMHDVMAHRLSLLATYAGALEYRPDSSPERLATAAGVIRGGLHEALDELREVITLLRDEDGAAEESTLRPLPTLRDLPRLVEECTEAGMLVTLSQAPGSSDDLTLQVGRAGYRVVQEGLTNARRHAPGQPVRVGVRRSTDSLRIEVANPVDADRRLVAGHGLSGLTERVELVGGSLRTSVEDGEYRLLVDFRGST